MWLVAAERGASQKYADRTKSSCVILKNKSSPWRHCSPCSRCIIWIHLIWVFWIPTPDSVGASPSLDSCCCIWIQTSTLLLPFCFLGCYEPLSPLNAISDHFPKIYKSIQLDTGKFWHRSGAATADPPCHRATGRHRPVRQHGRSRTAHRSGVGPKLLASLRRRAWPGQPSWHRASCDVTSKRTAEILKNRQDVFNRILNNMMSQGTDAALAQLPTQAIRANAQLDREEPQLSWSLSKLSGTLVEVVSFMMLWATFWGDSKMQQSVMRWFKAGRQESVFNPSDVECVDSYSILHQDSPEKILEEVLPGFLRLRCVVVWRLRGNSSEAGGPSRTVVPIGINLAYSGGLGSQVLQVVFGTVTWKHIIMQSLWRI